MSTVHPFPVKFRPPLRLVDSEPNFRDVEIRAAVHHLAKASRQVLESQLGNIPTDPAFVAAADDVEAALFHILMINGARNADRPLINLLAERLEARKATNHGGIA